MSESKEKKAAPEQERNPAPDPRAMRVAALKYNAETDPAPIVVAAGSGFVAQKILEIADEAGITVYHDESAATMLSKLNLGQEVPRELYQMVVDIYLTVLAAAKSSKSTIQLEKTMREKSPGDAGAAETAQKKAE